MLSNYQQSGDREINFLSISMRGGRLTKSVFHGFTTRQVNIKNIRVTFGTLSKSDWQSSPT